MKQKIIRDPVHNYIAIEEPWLGLLDSRETQRLRHIHQLGVSYFTYPGATHTRLAHTLGVFHLMRQAVEHLRQIEVPMEDDQRDGLLAGAIVHDIGHGPFSHLLEGRLGGNHEDWTRKIIQDDSTEIGRRLKAEGLTDRVAGLFGEPDPKTPRWMHNLISSQLDVDRMDYIQRDSHFTGAGYGHFDQYRILNTMELEDDLRHVDQATPTKHLAWPENSKYAIEECIIARFYLYQAVYFHKFTRGYEKLLQAIWDRAKALIRKGVRIKTYGSIRVFLLNDGGTVYDYLRLTEYDLLASIHEWSAGRDPVLADLCGRFLARRGFKQIICDSSPRLAWADRVIEARKHLSRQGDPFASSPESYLLDDAGGVHGYRPYRWGEREETNPIILKGNCEISEKLTRLRSVTVKEDFQRYYCPREHAAKLAPILKGTG